MSVATADYAQETRAVLRRVGDSDEDLKRRIPASPTPIVRGHLSDVIVVDSQDSPPPADLFDGLRWGGHVIFISSDKGTAAKFSLVLADSGFEITEKVSHITRGLWGLPIPIFAKRTYYFVARKVLLILPGKSTDRFTFHVYLEREPDGNYAVIKEVPTHDMIMARLRAKWPQMPEADLDRRARKFSDKIFPIFLTREAAILKIVNRDLPEAYRDRVPQLLGMEKDEKGYARRLHLKWLRNGGEPLSQLEFARQAADLLHVLHDSVGVIHLDLRLDNIVITPIGVCFVDFGSAVRGSEDLKQNPLLSSLFEELMRTSEIQRMLLSMTRTGQVTSEAIACGLNKVDKAVDYFYLAVQISAPHTNPDLKDLIRFNPQSAEAKLLSKLTAQILRPPDPAQPIFRSAADILRGIEEIRQKLSESSRATVAPSDNPSAKKQSGLPETVI